MIRLSHMNDSQKRAYVIADNRLAELGKWDQQLLALELEALQLSDPAFSIALTGFDDHEAGLIIDNVRPTSRWKTLRDTIVLQTAAKRCARCLRATGACNDGAARCTLPQPRFPGIPDRGRPW